MTIAVMVHFLIIQELCGEVDQNADYHPDETNQVDVADCQHTHQRDVEPFVGIKLSSCNLFYNCSRLRCRLLEIVTWWQVEVEVVAIDKPPDHSEVNYARDNVQDHFDNTTSVRIEII